MNTRIASLMTVGLIALLAMPATVQAGAGETPLDCAEEALHPASLPAAWDQVVKFRQWLVDLYQWIANLLFDLLPTTSHLPPNLTDAPAVKAGDEPETRVPPAPPRLSDAIDELHEAATRDAAETPSESADAVSCIADETLGDTLPALNEPLSPLDQLRREVSNVVNCQLLQACGA